MAKPKWLEQFDTSRQAGMRGFIMTGNTCDLIYYHGSPLAPCQARFFLAQYLEREGYDVYFYSLSHGLRQLRPDNKPKTVMNSITDPRSLQQVLHAFSTNLTQAGTHLALIVDYADHLCPVAHGSNALLSQEHLLALQTFHSWGTNDAIRAAQNLVILVSHENQVNDLLVRMGGGYRTVWIDLPSDPDRRQFTDLLLQLRVQRMGEFASLGDDLTPEEFVRMSSGLRLTDIERLFRRAAQEGAISREMVKEMKMQAISQMAGGLLEVKDTPYGMKQVAGMPHLKAFVQSLSWRWRAGASDLPQAILLAGVPGCGKSHSVMAIARELQLPCLAMRGIREQWVGASERNLERVLQIIETLTPCLVWIDEMDQAVGQRNTGPSADAGTSERMMARLWEFMGAMRHRGRILWVATTNRPDLLDPATLDRFPVVIPLLHPSPEEIEELLPMLARQLQRQLSSDGSLGEIAQIPTLTLPTVRSLQEIVVKAGEIADTEHTVVGTPIEKRHLAQAASLYKPNYNPVMHEFIALTAVQMTTFQDLLPWRAGASLLPYIAPLVDQHGNLDTQKLHDRLHQLRQALLGERIAKQV